MNPSALKELLAFISLFLLFIHCYWGIFGQKLSNRLKLHLHHCHGQFVLKSSDFWLLLPSVKILEPVPLQYTMPRLLCYNWSFVGLSWDSTSASAFKVMFSEHMQFWNLIFSSFSYFNFWLFCFLANMMPLNALQGPIFKQ